MTDKPISSFSRRFAAALRGYMTERGIRQSAVADRMNRSVGFVSEHLTGRRAVDTDMLDAIAGLAGVSSQALVEEVARRIDVADQHQGPGEIQATAQRMAETARKQVEEERAAEKRTKPKPKPRRRNGSA